MTSSKLTHLDGEGHARMVNVSNKPVSKRVAIAKGEVVMRPDTLHLIKEGNLKKGDVFTVAQIAGISAGKRTSALIPFCHPIILDHLSIEFNIDTDLPGVQIIATASSTGKTGVEMEALTAVSVAALTIYDMAKAVEKTIRIQNIRLYKKTGGQSGEIVNE
jgi:cyclic pyranopterin phosphate synthase